MTTTIYVSGPMTGIDNSNFPAFSETARQLRAAGYVVINPAENWGGRQDIGRAQCMRLDIQQVLVSDGIATLPGWRNSTGATCEVQIAHQIGIPVEPVAWWLQRSTKAA